ncbi:unnamed protein product, partial [Aphanomyces euteiches]
KAQDGCLGLCLVVSRPQEGPSSRCMATMWRRRLPRRQVVLHWKHLCQDQRVLLAVPARLEPTWPSHVGPMRRSWIQRRDRMPQGRQVQGVEQLLLAVRASQQL